MADEPALERAPLLGPAQHEVAWTAERIRRFWDYHGSGDSREDSYFSKLRGRSIIDFVSRRIPIGMALDMGCGRGGLIGYLLERYDTLGADQSPDSVATVNERFASHPRFHGAVVGTRQLASQSVDTIFIIEVIEHLDDETLSFVIAEARRLLRPGGHLVLSTPNDEDLDASKVICPECACVFHRWQHVRSWNPAGLEDYVRQFGFEGSAVPTLLSPYSGIKKALHRVVHRIRGHQLPHLVYIGASRG